MSCLFHIGTGHHLEDPSFTLYKDGSFAYYSGDREKPLTGHFVPEYIDEIDEYLRNKKKGITPLQAYEIARRKYKEYKLWKTKGKYVMQDGSRGVMYLSPEGITTLQSIENMSDETLEYVYARYAK